MRVLIIGLRATGAAVAEFCAARGDAVTVVEERPGQPGYELRRARAVALGAQVIEGEPDWDALVASTDLLVPSPGVRPAHPVMVAARSQRISIRGDLDLAVEAATVPVVVVTGTNGKSTVTTLISAMLEQSGLRAPAVGNIGRVALEVLGEAIDVLVVEASSFQLHTVTPTFAPDVAVLLNIAEDHLDWHGSFDAYVAAKANVFAYQDPHAMLIANADDPVVARIVGGAPAQVARFTPDAPRPGVVGWRESTLVDGAGVDILTLATPTIAAPHERANLGAAAMAAMAVHATPSAIVRAQSEFVRLHHRTEPVGQAVGVTFVDDSKATNPHAAIAAIRGFDQVVLLAGGDSKGIDLGLLATVSDHVRAVVAIGDTPEQIERVFEGVRPVRRASTMRDAVRTASELAVSGDVVLLSPACASFDWYASYAERGEDFRREVAALIQEHEDRT